MKEKKAKKTVNASRAAEKTAAPEAVKASKPIKVIDPFAELAEPLAAQPETPSSPAGTAAESEPPALAGGTTVKPKMRKARSTKAKATESEPPTSAGSTTSKPKSRKPRSATAKAAEPEPPVSAGRTAAKPKSRTAKTKTKAAGKPPAVPVASYELTDGTTNGHTSDPIFDILSDVTLPELEKENRARLHMQSPTQLFFYWSVRDNPWQRLKKIFGETYDSYTMVVKLTDLRRETEEIHPCDAEGSWWFAVEPDGEYRAEIGFYAVNRPYFRVLYSNTVATPRRTPSRVRASEARWTVSALKFAEVLDVAGFARDAFHVAIAGDDTVTADEATRNALEHLVADDHIASPTTDAEDIRSALLALAGGASIEDLRYRVGAALFALLQANADQLSAERVRVALSEHFDIEEAEWTEEEYSPAVFGSSRVHFPARFRPRNASGYRPVGSHSVSRYRP